MKETDVSFGKTLKENGWVACMTEGKLHTRRQDNAHLVRLTTGLVPQRRKVTPANQSTPLLILALLIAVAKFVGEKGEANPPSFLLLPFLLLQVNHKTQPQCFCAVISWAYTAYNLSLMHWLQSHDEGCIQEEQSCFAPASSDQSQNTIYLLTSLALIFADKIFFLTENTKRFPLWICTWHRSSESSTSKPLPRSGIICCSWECTLCWKRM